MNRNINPPLRKATKGRRIIFVAEQRGGLDVFLPVIKKIKHTKKFNFFLFSDNANVFEFARQHRIACRRFTGISLEKIEGIIKKVNPDIIFTDTNNTDFSASIDKKFIKISKKLKIPTVSIIDSWVGLKPRFGSKLEYLPDNILAIDGKMKKHLIGMGINPSIIKVTGNPRFDKFSKFKREKEKKNLIVFYSQPLYGQKPNEVEIFKDIVSAIEKTHLNKEIMIKFHPAREENDKDRKKYDNIIENSTVIIKKAKKNITSESINKKAELIVGINSIALVDASFMGKRVISYQPGSNKKSDTLRSNTHGWSVAVYKKPSLLPILRDIFKKPVVPKEEFKEYTKNNSTSKVISFVNDILIKK